MLDRLDRAFARQRQFVSDASHELRSPLTAIRGQLEVLAREESPSAAEMRRVEAMALTEMRRVERLVDDLLALARLDEGVGPALREVEVGPFLRGLADGERARRVEVGELADGAIRADPDLIAQVVRNLLANARRHAGPGAGSRSPRGPTAGELIVAVDDDGPGIPPGERERVFDRFHRSEPSRDRASGRQRPGPRHRPLDRRAARRPDLGRGLAPGRRPGRLRAARLRADDERSLSRTLRRASSRPAAACGPCISQDERADAATGSPATPA